MVVVPVRDDDVLDRRGIGAQLTQPGDENALGVRGRGERVDQHDPVVGQHCHRGDPTSAHKGQVVENPQRLRRGRTRKLEVWRQRRHKGEQNRVTSGERPGTVVAILPVPPSSNGSRAGTERAGNSSKSEGTQPGEAAPGVEAG
ncbi:hypothetical protein AB0D37_19160 [Streptomyces sp. NPDC048384]|uniref:hypothetical protein n=1 Tax=Streptomyces sp. NPDC048384 TaxID=3155487 RepID=UPI00342FA785